MFRRALTRIPAKNFIPDAEAKSLQLRLSIYLLSIVEEIKQSKTSVFQVHGEPGTGCSTLVQGLLQHLCSINYIKEEQILYLLLNKDCNESALWDLMSEVAKHSNNKEKSAFFSKASVKREEKIKAFLDVFKFKIICFDNACFNAELVDSLLEGLVDCGIKIFVLNLNKKSFITKETLHTRIIEVRGLNNKTTLELVTKYCSFVFEEHHISNLCEILNFNPVAIKLFCTFVNAHKLDSKGIGNILKDAVHWDNAKQQLSKSALDWIFRHIKHTLEPSSLDILYKLCFLRKPLPLVEVRCEINNLINLNLLVVKNENNVCCISIDQCLHKHLSYRGDIEVVKSSDFNVLGCWLSLVSNKLQSLVQDAEENAWPFVPEKWQYLQKVDKGENYNVKELLTSKNRLVPSLTELQILQECLYHAYIQDDFEKMAALVLVLDRFLYWQGDTKSAMDIVDYIQSKSPQTAIAPQLVIRRVRFMKNNGNLQEAEEKLNILLQAKSKIGQWKYRKEYEFRLVSGVCVQIKGEIQYRLGHWSKSASLLIQSIGYFESLPQPDKKGLAASYGLLSLCLRNMTVTDYTILAQNVGLFQCHPFLAAYLSGQEAARLSVYTPMFFLRHICQAGEVMLEFVNLVTNKKEKTQLLRIAIEDLKDSIQAHQTYASLTSREQFYLLVCAVYKISLALFQLGSNVNSDKEKGMKLKDLSSQLYEHYCSSSDRVLINREVIEVIEECLCLLGLEAFFQDNLANAGEVLVNYCKMRTAVRLKENTTLSSVGFFVNLKTDQANIGPEIFKREEQNQRVQVPQSTEVQEYKAIDETVDRSGDTAEIEENQVVPQAHQDEAPGKTVYRSAGTAEMQDDQINQQEHQDEALGDTVDRCGDTAEIQENQVIPQAHPHEAPGKTVQWFAGTPEIQDDQVNQQEHQDEALGDTVDRSGDTAEIQEAEEHVNISMSNVEHLTFHTVDQQALSINTMEQGGQRIIKQSLVAEAASLSSQATEISLTANNLYQKNTTKSKPNRVKDAILWKYDSPSSQWRGQPTMVYIGDQLKLDKGKEGTQRDVYTVEFINQDEQLGRYVAKCYRKNKTMQQYENDVLSQMTAKQYVALFNQQLYQVATGVPVGDIQFLPVVLLQLVNSNGQVAEVFNAEPYMSGEFTKLTNNTDWKNKHRRTDLVLAYSHFTYQASNSNLIIVDIQGWTPLDQQGCTFLTDPQIHSTVYKCFGTGNFGETGYNNFWKMHSECNEICKLLGLERPFNK